MAIRTVRVTPEQLRAQAAWFRQFPPPKAQRAAQLAEAAAQPSGVSNVVPAGDSDGLLTVGSAGVTMILSQVAGPRYRDCARGASAPQSHSMMADFARSMNTAAREKTLCFVDQRTNASKFDAFSQDDAATRLIAAKCREGRLLQSCTAGT